MLKATCLQNRLGQNQLVRKIVLHIRRQVFDLCAIAIFSREWKTISIQLIRHNLASIRIFRNRTAIVDYETTHNQQVYFKSFQSLHFEKDGPPLTLENYHNHYYLLLNLTSNQRCNQELC